MLCTAAQAQPKFRMADGTKYEFRPHGFLSVGGGVQHTLGETKIQKLLSPNAQLGLGYQFTTVFGARLQANAWQSKGGWNGHRAKIGDTPLTAEYKYNYVAPGIDLMFNLSNLFCSWYPFRTFNLTAFIGGGANIGFNNKEAVAIAGTVKAVDEYDLTYLWDGTKVRPYGRAGLEAAFRLSDIVSLFIEGNANILSDKYNSKKSERKLRSDWYFNALVGLKFNLGRCYGKVAPPPAVTTVEVVQTPQPEPEVVPVPAEEPVQVLEEVMVEPLRRDVFFQINQTKMLYCEAVKVKEVADYLMQYPKSKVTVTGYADAGTGNDRINDRLAAGRADTVVKALKRYGISADRISYDSKGARVQPFEKNVLNRVAICVAE